MISVNTGGIKEDNRWDLVINYSKKIGYGLLHFAGDTCKLLTPARH